MYEFPDEIWKYILDFAFDWKRTHRQLMKSTHESPYLLKRYHEIYERWTLFPPYPNTNDIIRAEYLHWRNEWAPPPNLPLTSITWNIKGTGGWWCGYGWRLKYNIK